jgi:peptide-methionine (S)-S-oxide reductase
MPGSDRESKPFHASLQALPLAALLIAAACSPATAVDPSHFPDPAFDEPRATAQKTEIAVLSGGCFWCTEAVFEQLAGVLAVTSGYTGGSAADAHYEIVSTGRTGHAESVRIRYDPSRITYGQILKVFFSVAHDPTTRDRQGPDWGHQYRSAIWFEDAEQEKIARAYIRQLDDARVFSARIVTEVSPAKEFYPAEEYHQEFVENNRGNPYVEANAIPKLVKLGKACPRLMKHPPKDAAN